MARRTVGLNIDASPVLMGRHGGELWVGSKPPEWKALSLAGFTALALVAEELQPEKKRFPGIRHVVRCELDDQDPPRPGDLQRASRCAREVATLVAQGHVVLVTCHMGLNRSALVCGLAARLLSPISGRSAVGLLQTVRRDSLFNRSYAKAVETFPSWEE